MIMENDTKNLANGDNFEESIQKVPEEVEDFMWSRAYDIIIQGIKKSLGLDDNQTSLVRNASYEVVAGSKKLEQVANELLEMNLPPELIAKIVYAIRTEIIERAANIALFYTPDESDEEEVISPPSPNDVLDMLKSRLTEARTVAPVARKIDMTIKPEPNIKEVPAPKKIDPYREQV